MPESSPDGTGQVPPVSQSPDSNGQVPPASQVSSTTTSESGTSSDGLTLEQARDALKKARDEAAKQRVDGKRLAELETLFQQQQDAKLSEAERLQKQYADLQTKAAEDLASFQHRLVRAETRGLAEKLGLKQELAQLLIKEKYAEIEFNEDGDPTNVAELLAKAVADLGLSALTAQAQQQATQQQQQQPTQAPGQQPAFAAPAMGATNPPRGSQVAGSNGIFARSEIPKLTDPRLWKK